MHRVSDRGHFSRQGMVQNQLFPGYIFPEPCVQVAQCNPFSGLPCQTAQVPVLGVCVGSAMQSISKKGRLALAIGWARRRHGVTLV